MEKLENKAYFHMKKNNSKLPFQIVQNLQKKRPSTTKLDLQKLYQQSLELSSVYKKLIKQNQQLKEQFQKVQTVKLNRQNLISTVQKIVQQKSKQINGKNLNNFSWLVFKLNNKIYDLKNKIQIKQKAILDLTLSKENDDIRQKQSEIECLNEMIQFARNQGLVKCAFNLKQTSQLSQIKQIVWMQQQLKKKQSQIIEAEKNYEYEQKQVRKIMKQLAKKKAQLKSIKEMQNEYNRAQQVYKQQKKKKQQKIAGNKSYLQQLQHQRQEQQKKLQNLRNKYLLMQQQQNKSINQLKQKLQKLKIQYEQKKLLKQKTILRISQEKVPQNKKKQVKRVTINQVASIGKNLNYQLALRGVNHLEIGKYFNYQQKQEQSIQQVFIKLKDYPFCMQNQEEALLIARYSVQDAGDGYFLQDMDTTQQTSIIKSVLTKLIGQVKVYKRQQAENKRIQIGKILSKFGKLVQQTLQMNQSYKNRQQSVRKTGRKQKLIVSSQILHEALESSLSSLQCQNFLNQQIEFTTFYLFSFSHNLQALDVNRIFTMINQQINWPQ